MELTTEDIEALRNAAQAVKSLQWNIKRALPVLKAASSVLEAHNITGEGAEDDSNEG